jgi:cell division protease FtsH
MMVTRWGFSPELGAVSYGENQDEVFLGMSVARTQNVSEATAQKIDIEIRRLVEEGHDEARKMLEAKRSDLEVLAKGLLEFETLSGDEIKDLLLGKKPTRESVIGAGAALVGRSAGRRAPAAGRHRPDEPRSRNYQALRIVPLHNRVDPFGELSRRRRVACSGQPRRPLPPA